MNTRINPLKVVPVSNAELERIQNYFKFFSPVQKPHDSVASPREEERWKVQRKLPSGLYFYERYEVPPIWKSNRFWQMQTPDSTTDDQRSLQYSTEQQLLDNPRLNVQSAGTWTVSWNPMGTILATAGDHGLTKLWDAKTGALITKSPMRTRSPHDTISWSFDGEVLAYDGKMFDGGTGEWLNFETEIGYQRYSSHTYAALRGTDKDLSSANLHSTNFSPFRPNSEQFVTEERNILVFRNRRTGEIERAIDCDVPSSITDFAWHPKGRFIAVAFKDHNVCIFDVDEVRMVDSLSFPYLVGWSHDGKLLVGRIRKQIDEFVVWNALKMAEEPLAEEVRHQLWFMRLFKNISADGLRYIATPGRSTSICSVADDRVLSCLSEPISFAAWSPIDGGLFATCGHGPSGSYAGASFPKAPAFKMLSGSETYIWRLQN